LAQVIRQRS